MQTFIKIGIVPILLIILIGCQSAVEPIESQNPSIVFEVSGGFWGQHHKLFINSSGLALNQTVYPTLELQLSNQERDSILALLSGFERYKDSYPYPALDAFHFKITLRTSKKEKTVDIDQFAFENNQELSTLAHLFTKLEKLEYRIYQEKSLWIGLQYQFSLDATTYKQNDTIKVLCRVTNPTTSQRILYFRNQYHLQFGFSNNSGSPNIQSWIPDQMIAWSDTSLSNQLIFDPGESKEISFLWNQSFENYSGEFYTDLPVGNYEGVIYLLAGPDPNGNYWNDYNIKFQIIN